MEAAGSRCTHRSAQGITLMSERAQMLMRLAADYIRRYHNYGLIFYDDAECDGQCLSDDLLAEADDMAVDPSGDRQ
jgi:hypothetical protein